jgi:hypothetical protein
MEEGQVFDNSAGNRFSFVYLRSNPLGKKEYDKKKKVRPMCQSEKRNGPLSYPGTTLPLLDEHTK